MNQLQVNYKVYLCAAGYEPEIRRITIDKDISHNYFYLKQKLMSIFPTLKDGQFTISWKDHEGDTVRICSDQELLISLHEMDGQTYKKIFIATTPQQGSEGPLHPNIFCDSCEHLIQGFRYKCIVCPDFDLCADCERAQNHPDHPMIRIPLPLSPEMPFSRRFGRDLHKMSKHLDHLLRQSEKWWGDSKARGENNCSHPRKHGEKKHKPCPFGVYAQAPESLCKAFSELMDGYLAFVPEQVERANHAPEQQSSPSAPSQQSGQPNFDEQKKFVEILRQGLSSFIDPLGADIPTPREGAASREEPAPQASSSNDASSSTSQQTEYSTPIPEPSQAQPQPQPQAQYQPQAQFQPQPHPQPQVQSMNEEKPMDIDAGGDSGGQREVRFFQEHAGAIRKEREETPVLDNTWTVINNRENEQTFRAAEAQTLPPTATAATETNVNSGPVPGKIYPAIPVMPIGPSGDLGMNLVDSTMQKMLAMGFSDEGGWLRQLVESKQGNLEEVLRFLSPIPKPTPKKQ